MPGDNKVTDFTLDRELLVRVISALVLVPVVIAIIFIGGQTFTILVGLTSTVMAFEWIRMIGVKINWVVPLTSLWAAIIAIILTARSGDEFLILTTSALIIGGAVWIAGIAAQRAVIVWSGLGIMYIVVPIASFLWLRALPDGAMWLLWTLLVVWAADVGGYFAGRILGGRKLIPTISPNKTWAGFIGGTLLAGAAGLLGAVIGGFGNPFVFFMIGSLAGIWSQVGDVVESAVKRHFGVKDTGNIIPGHGGLLDRIDGLMFLAPAVMLGHLLVA